MRDITIHPIPLFMTYSRQSKAKMTYLSNFGEDLTTCCYVWLIRGYPQNILVDGGASPDLAVLRGRSMNDLLGIQSLERGLAKYDLKVEDIDIVVLTHLHWDHVALAQKFVNAQCIVQKRELDFARNPDMVTGHLFEKRYFNNLNFQVVEGDQKILDGLEVLLTPGHSGGGQSVLIKTMNKNAIITGFCCVQDNFIYDKETGELKLMIIPGIHIDVTHPYQSLQKIKHLADIIIPIHEPYFSTVPEINSNFDLKTHLTSQKEYASHVFRGKDT